MTMKTKKTLQHIAAVAVVLLALCLVFAAPVSANTDESEAEGDTEAVAYVAQIGETQYESLDSALKALKSGDTLLLLKSVTISDNWDCRNNGAKITVPVTIDGKGNTIKLTGTVDDKNWNTVFRFEEVATVKNLTIDVSGATGVQRGISTKLSITVDNCKFIGNGKLSNSRAIIFGEGAGDALSTVEASITNSEFNNWGYGVSDNQGGKDAKSVSITNNKFKQARVLVSAYETVTFTRNQMDGGYVNIHSYSTTPSLEVTATGNTLDPTFAEDNKISAEKCIKSYTADEGFVIGLTVQVGDVYYKNLQDALAVATEGSTIRLLPGTISEGTIKMPATLKNVVIKGAENKASVLKDTELMSADGSSISYEGITIDGIVFDNSNIVITGWRTDVTTSDWTIQNCEFKNIVRTTENHAAVHFNFAATEAPKNVIIKNNVIDGVSGKSNSGIYLQATGTVQIENNVINNVAFRPYLIQMTTDDGIADTLTVTGNTFSGSSVGRLQALGNNGKGTDAVVLTVNNNILKGITNSQQICYWNFNAETTTFDFSGNYYDIDLFANPGKIDYNSACSSVDDLIAAKVFPYYNALTADGKIDTTSIVEPTYTISAENVGFDSVKVGYTQPAAKDITVVNTGNLPVTISAVEVSDNYQIGTVPTTEIPVGEAVTFTIQPASGLAVGNYEEIVTVTTTRDTETTFKVSFLVYQPSSGGSSTTKPEEPVEPETPVEPENPTEEPEAGEPTVETEVTDGGEVLFEEPVAPETPGADTPSDEPAEPTVTGVVLPEGTDSEVAFIPVSEKPAPAGKETQTKKVFEINVPKYEKGKPATVKFTMTVAELAADGKTAADVALWHQDEETGEWTKLVTTFVIIDGVVYFEAITFDFSPFAIVYEDVSAPTEPETPEQPTESPAPILAVLAGLGAAVVLRRK